jgi:hypothetical protein
VVNDCNGSWSVGQSTVRSVGLSYENAVIAENEGRPAGGLISCGQVATSQATSQALSRRPCAAAQTREQNIPLHKPGTDNAFAHMPPPDVVAEDEYAAIGDGIGSEFWIGPTGTFASLSLLAGLVFSPHLPELDAGA